MARRLIAITAAIFIGSSCAYAQVGGMATPAPSAGMGMTSPLGMSSSGTAVAPTGIPLGAAPLATPGVTGTSNGIASATACSSPSIASAMTGSTAQFDNSGVGIMTGATLPGSAAPVTTTCGPASAAPSASASQSSTSTPSQLGVPTIPMGSTELSNPGLSPAPCAATGNTSATPSDSC